MAYIGNSPALKYASFAVQHFTTSATTGYTLDNSVANENDIALFVNNVRQQPGGSYAYTAAGTTLTLSAATTVSDTMYCVFIGKAVQTVIPPVGSVGLSQLSATGTASSSTFLRGDNAWQDPGGVALTGSTDNTVVTVTGADAIAGEANLTSDGTYLTIGTATSLGKLTITGGGDDVDLLTFTEDGTNQTFSFNGDFSGSGATGNILNIDSAHNDTIMSMRTDGCITKPLQPAFLAMASASQDGLGNGVTITGEFDTEIFDQNEDYNTGTYTFTAPITGRYFLSMNYSIENFTPGSFQRLIVTSNRSYGGNSFMADDVPDCIAVIADMDANDTAVCQWYVWVDTSWDLKIYPNSFFSGMLMA